MRDAASDIRYLLNRGYPREGTIKFVCDHYRIDAAGRHILSRVVYPDSVSNERRVKLMDCNQAAGSDMVIDGFNVLISVECMLEDEPLYLCDDGLVRDTRGVFHNYRQGSVTGRALYEIATQIRDMGAASVLMLFDSQISRSGELAKKAREHLRSRGITGDAIVSRRVDHDLKSCGRPVATGDGAVIDAVEKVICIPLCIMNRLGKTPLRL